MGFGTPIEPVSGRVRRSTEKGPFVTRSAGPPEEAERITYRELQHQANDAVPAGGVSQVTAQQTVLHRL